MNDRQRTIFQNWVRDNLFLIDGMLLHKRTVRAIRDRFQEAGQGFWCTDDDVRLSMISLGFQPTSDDILCSFIPMAMDNTPAVGDDK